MHLGCFARRYTQIANGIDGIDKELARSPSPPKNTPALITLWAVSEMGRVLYAGSLVSHWELSKTTS